LELPIGTKSVRERIINIGGDGGVVAIATEVAPGGRVEALPAAGQGSSLAELPSAVDRGSSAEPASMTAARRTGTEPATAGAPPTVIFLNAGVLHRVGPHRLHVTLARLLAECGFPGLRIDLSGIGDSRPLPGVLTFRESSVVDARAAMDELSATAGVARFLLFGLCSGADNALATAREDERVVGLVLLDPPCHPTLRSRLRKLVGRIQGLTSFSAAARWSVRVLRRRLSSSPPEPENPRQASADEFGRNLVELLDRGVQILCIYSGANAEGYNHRDQLFELFPGLRGRIHVVYFPAANHVFTERAAREKLIGTVIGWCQERFRGCS
jgi:pimeloyl-ACP methyl ester carboxylesterase